MNFSFKSWSSPNTWLFIFIGLLLLLFLSMIAIFYQVSVDSKQDEIYLRQVTQLRLLSQQITQQASLAARGKESGFKTIVTKSKELQNILNILKDNELLQITPVEVTETLNELIKVWEKVNEHIESLLSTQEGVILLYGQFAELTRLTDDIFVKTQATIDAMVAGNATPMQMHTVVRQLMLLERISNSIRVSFRGDSEAIEADSQINEDISNFGDAITTLLDGSDEMTAVKDPIAQKNLQELATLFTKQIEQADAFLDKSEQLFQVKDASQVIIDMIPKMLDVIEKLQQHYVKITEQRFISTTLGNILAGLVLLLLVLLSAIIARINKARSEETRLRLEENQSISQKNQEDILLLLNEIADLADGDLTVTATVGEGRLRMRLTIRWKRCGIW